MKRIIASVPSKHSVLFLSMVLLLSVNSPILASETHIIEAQHDHDCTDYTSNTHAEHGDNDCGNADKASDHTPGEASTCTDTNRGASGQLVDGQWLACGSGAGPGGADGCSYQWVTFCGGRMRSAEVLMGRGSDGYLPACWHTADGTGRGIQCETLTGGDRYTSNATYQYHGASCSPSGFWQTW